MKLPVKLRYAIAAAALAGMAASAGFAGVLRSDEKPAGRPALTLVADTPVVLAGRGFVPGENVSVKAYGSGGRFSKSVTAGTRGKFVARFLRSNAACTPLSASAIGTKGSRASFRRQAIPGPCGIDPQP